MAPPLKDLVRGDVPLARLIFGDPAKRKLIAGLQADGWPIFDLAGKRCGFAHQIDAKIASTLKAGQKRK